MRAGHNLSEEILFRERSADATRDVDLRNALRKATDTFIEKRERGTAEIPLDDWREKASERRLHVLDHLTEYVDEFARNAVRAGASVHRAEDGEAARTLIADILKDRNARKIVKAKSMITEEIHLNKYLEDKGHEVIETDLGEYIVQLAGETPSHILAPAIHKSRRQVGRLFAEKLGVEFSDNPEVLTKIARKALRREFLTAEAGISGANFGIAASGSLVIFTNEGNGRMTTTLPPLHIAVMSLEKMLPSFQDLPLFLRLLPRSASGQKLSSYVSIITGPKKHGETTGASELHIVLLDNGRTRIKESPYREILKCIRCSACLNVCPVYRVIGGHAYDSTYPGPMGVILTSLLDGMDRAHPLADATTLCGACSDACPVKVPLTKLLRMFREDRVSEGRTSFIERLAMAGYGLAVSRPRVFRAGHALAKLSWPILKHLFPSGIFDRLPNPAERILTGDTSEFRRGPSAMGG